MTLRRSGQLDEAEQTCTRALELFTALDTTTDRGLVLWNLGWVYLNRRAFDAAIDTFRAALDMCGDDRRQRAFCWHGLTETERQRGDLTTAGRYAERTLEIWIELGDRRGEVYTLRGIGLIHIDQGQPHRARPVLMRAMGIFEELGLVDGQAMVLTDLADVSMLGDDPAGAAELLRRAVQLGGRSTRRSRSSTPWYSWPARTTRSASRPAPAPWVTTRCGSRRPCRYRSWSRRCARGCRRRRSGRAPARAR